MSVTSSETPRTGRQMIRRSVALPIVLVGAVFAAAPPEIGHNLNRLVTESLCQCVAQRKADIFAKEMRQMAADPTIQAVSAGIAAGFLSTELDGLL